MVEQIMEGERSCRRIHPKEMEDFIHAVESRRSNMTGFCNIVAYPHAAVDADIDPRG